MSGSFCAGWLGCSCPAAAVPSLNSFGSKAWPKRGCTLRVWNGGWAGPKFLGTEPPHPLGGWAGTGQSPGGLCHGSSSKQLCGARCLSGFLGLLLEVRTSPLCLCFLLASASAWTQGKNYALLIGTLGLRLTSACRGGHGLGEEASKSPGEPTLPLPPLPGDSGTQCPSLRNWFKAQLRQGACLLSKWGRKCLLDTATGHWPHQLLTLYGLVRETGKNGCQLHSPCPQLRRGDPVCFHPEVTDLVNLPGWAAVLTKLPTFTMTEN